MIGDFVTIMTSTVVSTAAASSLTLPTPGFGPQMPWVEGAPPRIDWYADASDTVEAIRTSELQVQMPRILHSEVVTFQVCCWGADQTEAMLLWQYWIQALYAIKQGAFKVSQIGRGRFLSAAEKGPNIIDGEVLVKPMAVIFSLLDQPVSTVNATSAAATNVMTFGDGNSYTNP